MEFDWKEFYDSNIRVYCKTEEERKDFEEKSIKACVHYSLLYNFCSRTYQCGSYKQRDGLVGEYWDVVFWSKYMNEESNPTTPRLLVLTEDYSGSLLTMTDCNNDELKKILDQAEENLENNIGKSLTEICKELFTNRFMLEIGCSEESDYAYITDLNTEVIATSDTLTFSVVRGELE